MPDLDAAPVGSAVLSEIIDEQEDKRDGAHDSARKAADDEADLDRFEFVRQLQALLFFGADHGASPMICR